MRVSSPGQELLVLNTQRIVHLVNGMMVNGLAVMFSSLHSHTFYSMSHIHISGRHYPTSAQPGFLIIQMHSYGNDTASGVWGSGSSP